MSNAVDSDSIARDFCGADGFAGITFAVRAGASSGMGVLLSKGAATLAIEPRTAMHFLRPRAMASESKEWSEDKF